MDRRKTPPRIDAEFNAGYGTLNSGMLLPCRIVDISWGGSRIELFTKHSITAGTTIELHIEVPGLARRVVSNFRCLWTRPLDRTGNEEGNIIGGCFTEMSSEERHLLLDHAKKQSLKNQAAPPQANNHYAHTGLQST